MTTVGVPLHGPKEAPGRRSETNGCSAPHRRARTSRAPGPSEGLASERELWRRFARTATRRPGRSWCAATWRSRNASRSATAGASESLDDLLQVANIGLLNAVDRFDPDRGIPFTAFASPTILGELKRHFRDRVWTVRVPRGLHDRMAEVDKAITELTKELQRSPSVAQIAERLELEMTDVLEVLEANHNRRPLSLDRPAGGDEAEEAAPSEWIGGEDEGFELVEGRIALDAALPYLDERERLVLRMRFVDDMTQSQIAEQVGHSQMHVSRILRRALPGSASRSGSSSSRRKADQQVLAVALRPRR